MQSQRPKQCAAQRQGEWQAEDTQDDGSISGRLHTMAPFEAFVLDDETLVGDASDVLRESTDGNVDTRTIKSLVKYVFGSSWCHCLMSSSHAGHMLSWNNRLDRRSNPRDGNRGDR